MTEFLTFTAFFCLGASLVSVWITPSVWVWGTLAGLSVFLGAITGHIGWQGLAALSALALLWGFYDRRETFWLFAAIVFLSISFKLRWLPGFTPYFITSKFALGFDNPFIGLFPLALIVPLAATIGEWKGAFKGALIGVLGIVLIAILATATGAVRWDFALIPYMPLRVLCNLIFTVIPEEGFYRGFVQAKLTSLFKNSLWGNIAALVGASLLFMISHIHWSPNPALLAFTFIAGLFYGSVYLYTRRIESAILVHFLLNVTHMIFFSYPAA